MSDVIPAKLRKRIAGECLHCTEHALDGSDYCAPHDAHERGQRAARQRRLRARRAKGGECAAGCGRKVNRRRIQGGGYQLRECSECAKQHRKRSAEARKRVRNERVACVTSDTDDVGVWREDPGTSWMRFRGKARRGRLTREEQIDEDARDARFAIAEIEKFIASLGELKRPEVMDLPKIQKEAARRTAAQFLGTAGRFLEELEDKYR